jgi:hypothetical protein
MFMIVLTHESGTFAIGRTRDRADWVNVAIVSAETMRGKHRMPNTRHLALLLLCTGAGCASLRSADDCGPRGFSFVHHLGKPPEHLQQACQAIPAEARNHVYLFAINGMDPLYMANLNGLCGSMKQLGFRNVQCGSAWQTNTFRDAICRVREQDPQARVAVVGFSAGANRARQLANELNAKGVRVDLLMYVGGDTIDNTPASRPTNVGQLVNITGHGYLPRGGDLFYNGTDLVGAQNQRLNARHMLLPTRPETVETLATQMIVLARRTP